MNIEKPPAARATGGPQNFSLRPALGYGLDADELSHAAAIVKLDHARHFREQRVILTPADIHAGLDVCAALPHDDRPAGHQLSAENLHAQPLRVGIAAVAGAS